MKQLFSLHHQRLVLMMFRMICSLLVLGSPAHAFGLPPPTTIPAGVFGGDPITSTHHFFTMASSAATPTLTISPPLNALPFNPVNMYMQALTTWPLVTKMATGAVLATAGDGLAQAREVDQPYDGRRATSFALFDMAYRALQHVSYPVIVAHFHGQYLCSVASLVLQQYYVPLDVAAGMERTLCSQLGIVPFLYYPVFFTLTAAMQGLNAEQGWQRAREMFVPLMQRNLLFWIPAQYIQFSYVPEDLQIPFVSVCGLVWTAILSVLAGAAASKESLPEDDGPYCVIGTESECILPDDALFPDATLEEVAEELAHDWDVVTHEMAELVTHTILHEADAAVAEGEDSTLSSSPTEPELEKEEATTTALR